MRNKIVKSVSGLAFILGMGFVLMPGEAQAKIDIGGPYDPPMTADCEGAAGHCLTYGDVMYYGRLVINP